MKNVRKLLIAGIVAAAATVGVGVPQASAATSTTACFDWGYNAPAPGTDYRNRTVELWRVNSSGAAVQRLRVGRTDSNGRGTFFNTPSNVYLRMRAIHVDYIYGDTETYEGWTNRIALPGSGGALLGVGQVIYYG